MKKSKFEKTVAKAEAIQRAGYSPSTTKKGSGRRHCSGLSKKVKAALGVTHSTFAMNATPDPVDTIL